MATIVSLFDPFELLPVAFSALFCVYADITSLTRTVQNSKEVIEHIGSQTLEMVWEVMSSRTNQDVGVNGGYIEKDDL